MALVSPALLSAVIADIYDAAQEPGLWTRVLPSIADIFASQQVAYNVLDGSGRSAPFIAAHGLGAGDLELFRAFAATTNVPQWYQIAPMDRPSLRSAVSPDREFSRSPYYNEVIRPSGSFHALLGPVIRGAAHQVDLFVARERALEDYAAEDLAMMQILTAHLRRAVGLSDRLATGRSLLSVFSHLPFGVMFVDPHLRVVEMNAAAEAIALRRHGPLGIKSGVLSVAVAESHLALQQLVLDVCRVRNGLVPGVGGDVLIRSGRRGAGADFALSVVPLIDPQHELSLAGPHAAIFIREISLELPTGFREQVRAFFGLTPKETGLAASLASGMTLKEAAADADIRINTARSYLDSIFLKTGTHQQSELVALLKSPQTIVRRSKD
jgi:DNA-binding CsgD family transcriptional regulator